MILAESVHTLLKIWKNYDWKSKVDWHASRKSLVGKISQTITKWMEFAHRLNCEHQFKEKISVINH